MEQSKINIKGELEKFAKSKNIRKSTRRVLFEGKSMQYDLDSLDFDNLSEGKLSNICIIYVPGCIKD